MQLTPDHKTCEESFVTLPIVGAFILFGAVLSRPVFLSFCLFVCLFVFFVVAFLGGRGGGLKTYLTGI